MVFYLMRNLSKAKVDLDDKEIELESEDSSKETNKKESENHDS